MSSKRKLNDRNDLESTEKMEQTLRNAATLTQRTAPRFQAPVLDAMKELGVSSKDLLSLTSIDKRESVARDHLLQAHTRLNLNKVWAQVFASARSSMPDVSIDDQSVYQQVLKEAREYIAKYRPFEVMLSVNDSRAFASELAQLATQIYFRFTNEDAEQFKVDKNTIWPPKLKKIVVLSGSIDFREAVWPESITTLVVFPESAQFTTLPPKLAELYIQVEKAESLSNIVFPTSLKFLSVHGFESEDELVRNLKIRWPDEVETLVLDSVSANFDGYVFPESIVTLVLSGYQIVGLDTVTWPSKLKNLKIKQSSPYEEIDPHVPQLAPLPETLETFWWILEDEFLDQSPDSRVNDFDAMLGGLPKLQRVLFDSQQRFDLSREPTFQVYIDEKLYPKATSSNLPGKHFVDAGPSKEQWEKLFPNIELK